MFDRPLLAKAAIERAIELATENKLGQWLRRSPSELLEELQTGRGRERARRGSASGAASWSPEVLGVANRLLELRTMAGVSG